MKEVKNIRDYSSASVEEVLNDLSTSKKGLSFQEAKKRIREYGANTFVEERGPNIILSFLSHFKSPFILILLLAAAVSFFIGETTNGVIILGIVLFGATLDFSKEYSAGKSLKKLIESVETTAIVIREGKKKEISIKYLVPGDIIFLNSGDMIPADARIIESDNLFTNQASITGESFPVEKTANRIDSSSKSIIELNNILFSGANVVSGNAIGVVIKTGKNTEFGKIVFKVSQTKTKTEFEKGMSDFGVLLMKITFFLVVFIFLINSLLKHNFFESFVFAIAIAVGITPDLLPMITSITMAIGSKKMSEKGVIVKKLSSISNFGSMNILCTDKTGTLTENKIKLVSYLNTQGKEDDEVLRLAYLNSSFQDGIQNPIDDAILKYKKLDTRGFKKIGEIPYDFSRKSISVIIRRNDEIKVITKGAPERILTLCKNYTKSGRTIPFEKSSRDIALKEYNDLSSQGYRVLAVSTKKISAKNSYSQDDEDNSVFEGFVSFFDPPKKDVRETIGQIQKLGIEVKIITGDNELVTKKVSQEVGLEIRGILTGNDLDKMDDEKLLVSVQRTTIFARCSPDQKTRVINALRSANNVVGYIGDGINDASSLKSADVSISVNTAVDVAKESADIILTRKSLGDLKEGIIEGRKTFGNNMKYIMMGLSSNFGNMVSAAGAVLFLPFLPMLPIQILLNNLLYDLSQITIPTDNVDSDWISEPKKWNMEYIKKFMFVFGILSSVFDFLTFFILFFVLKVTEPIFQTGWFITSFASQVLVIHIIRTKKMPIIKSRASKLLTLSTLIIVAVGWAIPYTIIGSLFGFTPLPKYLIIISLGIVAAYLILVEITKRIFYRRVSL